MYHHVALLKLGTDVNGLQENDAKKCALLLSYTSFHNIFISRYGKCLSNIYNGRS